MPEYEDRMRELEIVAEWDDLELDLQILDEKLAKVREGLRLFSLWFMHLWA